MPKDVDRTAAKTAPAVVGPMLVLAWYYLVLQFGAETWPRVIVAGSGIAAAVIGVYLVWVAARRGLVSQVLFFLASLAGMVLTAGCFLTFGSADNRVGDTLVLGGVVLWLGVFCALVVRVVFAARK